MPLTEPQQRIFDDDSRFRVAVCGRRFGKTYLALWEIARAARWPNQRILYCAPNFRQAKGIIWDLLKEELGKRRWIRKINESELSIRLCNNSLIELRSAESADSMRGISGSFAVLDECAFYDKRIWSDVIRPLLSDQEGGCLFITTPQGQNWVYDLYLQAKTRDDWSAFQYTTLDGGQVSSEEVEAAKRDLDERTFRTEYLADFTSTSNRVFYAFDMQTNVRKLDVDPGKIWIGCDQNINPMSAVIGTPVEDGFYVFDEIELYNSNTNELCEEIINRYGTRPIIHPDPSGKRNQTNSKGRSDHDIMREYGLIVKSPKAHTPVKDRNAVVNSLFRNAAGEHKLFISPDCKRTIHNVASHQYKPNSVIPEKDKGTDHMTDALAYVLDYNFSIRSKPDMSRKPRSYGI